MNGRDDPYRRMARKWLPRIWGAYAILWLISMAVVFAFGGFETPLQAIPMVIGGIVSALGLVSVWQMRRDERRQRDAS